MSDRKRSREDEEMQQGHEFQHVLQQPPHKLAHKTTRRVAFYSGVRLTPNLDNILQITSKLYDHLRATSRHLTSALNAPSGSSYSILFGWVFRRLVSNDTRDQVIKSWMGERGDEQLVARYLQVELVQPRGDLPRPDFYQVGLIDGKSEELNLLLAALVAKVNCLSDHDVVASMYVFVHERSALASPSSLRSLRLLGDLMALLVECHDVVKEYGIVVGDHDLCHDLCHGHETVGRLYKHVHALWKAEFHGTHHADSFMTWLRATFGPFFHMQLSLNEADEVAIKPFIDWRNRYLLLMSVLVHATELSRQYARLVNGKEEEAIYTTAATGRGHATGGWISTPTDAFTVTLNEYSRPYHKEREVGNASDSDKVFASVDDIDKDNFIPWSAWLKQFVSF